MSILQPGQSLADLSRLAEDEAALGVWLLTQWCKGKSSAENMIEGARQHLRTNPDCCDELIKKLAATNTHNAHRDITKYLRRRRPEDFPPVYVAKIPLWNKDMNISEDIDVPFLLPHEWLSMYAETDPRSFCDCYPEVQARLEEWRARVGCPEAGAPIAPISIWGDSAPYHTGSDSIYLVLWSPLCKSQSKRRWVTMVSKNQLCSCGCDGAHTLDGIWNVMAWSLRAACSGLYPSEDHLGRAFTAASDPWRAKRRTQELSVRSGCLMFRGDWPWLSSVFRLSYHSSTDACFLCRGRMENGPRQLTDCYDSALWRTTIVNGLDWVTSRIQEGGYLSSVFSWPGFTFDMVILDWMHMADLGVSQTCLGNILFELFRGDAIAGLVSRPEPGLGRLQAYLAEAAHSLGLTLPFSSLQLSMIRAENLQPRLKLKAAKTRRMVPIVLRMLEIHFPAVTEREVRRYNCLKYLHMGYELLENWDADAAKKLEDYCKRHVLLYLSLAREHLQEIGPEGVWVFWRFFPKHHMLLHLSGEQARRFGNPRDFWCYMDEGTIGIAVDVAESCHPRTLAFSCIDKYLMLLCLV